MWPSIERAAGDILFATRLQSRRSFRQLIRIRRRGHRRLGTGLDHYLPLVYATSPPRWLAATECPESAPVTLGARSEGMLCPLRQTTSRG